MGFKVQWKYPNEDVPRFLRIFIAEILGTGILMFLGCMGCITQVNDPPATHHMGGLAFGFAVLIVIQCIGHISMAHINPAVTITSFMLSWISPLMALNYWTAQMIGGISGFGLLKLLMPPEWVSGNFCMTLVHSRINVVKAFFIEICITAILCGMISSIWDKRNLKWGDSVAIKFGCVIFLLSFCAGPFTGASMNTVRSLAPAIFSGNWSNHWIYWIAPNLGSIIGTGIYMIVFAERRPKDEETTV